ncbi:hypothetical protein GCM10027565_04760 [Bordetella tumulicola]
MALRDWAVETSGIDGDVVPAAMSIPFVRHYLVAPVIVLQCNTWYFHTIILGTRKRTVNAKPRYTP